MNGLPVVPSTTTRLFIQVVTYVCPFRVSIYALWRNHCPSGAFTFAAVARKLLKLCPNSPILPSLWNCVVKYRALHSVPCAGSSLTVSGLKRPPFAALQLGASTFIQNVTSAGTL